MHFCRYVDIPSIKCYNIFSFLEKTEIFDVFYTEKIKNEVFCPLEVKIFDLIDSTNAEARRIALGEEWDKAPVLILAYEQSAGRGRLGRSFQSRRNEGIFMSLLYYTAEPLHNAVSVTTAAAVFVAEEIEGVVGGELKIKWVNDIYMKSKNIPNTLFANTTYLPYGCVINAVMAFSKEKPPFILPKKYPPTYRLQEIVFKFLKEGTLSSDLEKTLNERLNFLTNIDIKLLEEGHLLEKFLMVLGEAFNGANQSSDTKYGEYNQDTYLAQAILLDLEHNYFKNKITENSKKYDDSLAHKQKLYKEIRREITDALYMEPWVIKPNKKLGNAEKSTLARDGLSACAQVKHKDENLAIQVWAEYLQTLASYTYKFAPHLLEEYPFLKKELAGKQQDLKKLKQKETGLWL